MRKDRKVEFEWTDFFEIWRLAYKKGTRWGTQIEAMIITARNHVHVHLMCYERFFISLNRRKKNEKI